MGFNKEAFKKEVISNVKSIYRRTIDEATPMQIFQAVAYAIKEYVMDPGFGFAKNLEQNYELFKGMPQLVDEIAAFAGVRRRLLVGISRKGMIWKPLGITPDEALCGTSALNLQALLLGADILRVHDVAQARQCIKIWELLR